MDESLWSLMTIIGPVILLILLIWLVMRSRRGTNQTTDTTTRSPAYSRTIWAEPSTWPAGTNRASTSPTRTVSS